MRVVGWIFQFQEAEEEAEEEFSGLRHQAKASLISTSSGFLLILFYCFFLTAFNPKLWSVGALFLLNFGVSTFRTVARDSIYNTICQPESFLAFHHEASTPPNTIPTSSPISFTRNHSNLTGRRDRGSLFVKLKAILILSSRQLQIPPSKPEVPYDIDEDPSTCARSPSPQLPSSDAECSIDVHEAFHLFCSRQGSTPSPEPLRREDGSQTQSETEDEPHDSPQRALALDGFPLDTESYSAYGLEGAEIFKAMDRDLADFLAIAADTEVGSSVA